MLLHFYHRIPPPLQNMAASLRGYSLRSWRYGPETEKLVEDALEREQWPPRCWRVWQEERLALVLHRAATRVPFYREQWARRRRGGDHASWEYLENWPILQKETLRQIPRAFVADDCDLRRMFHDHTSGTSGTPLDLWLSKATVRGWYALFEVRARCWNQVSRHENWAILGGQPVVAAQRKSPPFWVWNAPMRQLYLSANHLSRRNSAAFMAALRQHRVTHMIVYPSSAALLAREARDLGLSAAGVRMVVTNAEPLLAWQRDLIQQGFGGAVRETYGMAEIVTAASECSHGRLHLWPEAGWVEVLDDAEDRPLPRGDSGRFVCTSLLNADMPLVRYQVGDRGCLTGQDESCGCGRTLPIVARIEGRTNDLLRTADGRRVYWLNPVFYGLPICEAQIIQETLERVVVRYVAAAGFTANTADTIAQRLRERLGAVQVEFDPVSEIPRAANGKFRAVVCNLPKKFSKPVQSARCANWC